ncbi:MAG TPA: hypothetical protein VD833_14890 [Vicinamibacterales bacterium]|nr:hypothetical protein [Vicinamibacterales bacterium]
MAHLRSTLLVALVLGAVFARPAAADPDKKMYQPRLRAAGDVEQRLIEDAARRSPSVQRLIDQLECTDVYVYVQLTGSPQVRTASTSLVTATPRGRYLRILISAGLPAWTRIHLLGHELQHVLEIAGDPGVTSQAGMRELFGRIGHSAETADRFETGAAREVEHLVRTELLQAGKRGPDR